MVQKCLLHKQHTQIKLVKRILDKTKVSYSVNHSVYC